MKVKSRALSRIFLRLAEAFTETATTRANPSRCRPASRVHRRALKKRLDELFRSNSRLITGKLQVIELREVRDKLGSKWKKLAEKAGVAAEKIIQRRLTPGDIFFRYGDNSFLILFSDLNAAEARVKTAAITLEIRKHLLGDSPEDDLFWPKSAVASLGDLPEAGKGDIIDTLIRALDEKIAEDEKRTTGKIEPLSLIGDMVVTYRPTLNVAKNIVSTFAALPKCEILTGKLLVGGACSRTQALHALDFEIDLTMLSIALSHLQQRVDDKQTFLIMVPIRFQSFSVRDVARLIDLLRQLPDDLRRLLVLEVLNIDTETPSFHLVDRLTRAYPFCRAIVARVPFNFPLDVLTTVGITGVGVDASETRYGIDENVSADTLANFVKRAKGRGLHPYIFGVKSDELFQTALTCGFYYINGDAIFAEVPKPTRIDPYEPGFPISKSATPPSPRPF